MNINNASIATRLSAAFGLIAALVLGAAIAGNWGLRSIVATALGAMEGDLRLAQLASEINGDVLQLRRYEKDVFINIQSAEKARSYVGKWEAALQGVEAACSTAEEIAPVDAKGTFASLASELRLYAAGFRETVQLITSAAVTTTAQANDAMSKHKAAIYRVETLVEEIREVANARAAGSGEAIRERQRTVTATLVSLTAISLLLATVLAFVITQGISRPLRSAIHLAQRIAEGELGHDVTVERKDEVGQLLSTFNEMDQSLRQIVNDMRLGADTVRSTAAELAESNELISQRTQEQAASLEQTAASLEEMTSSLQANAAGAGEANQLARSAHEAARSGGAVVTQAVAAMEAINDASRRISDIISVIDEIAFQTNLLALNAAVEAARAGEGGRGFAVVAGEVRNLAQRSAESAKQIKALIGDSADKVHTGSELVARSGEHLNSILQSVQRVTDVVAQIAAANSQQAMGVTQLNDAVSQLDATTQSNSAAVEQISAASKLMYEQSEQLARKAGFFRVLSMGDTRRSSAQPSSPDESSTLQAMTVTKLDLEHAA